MPRLTERATGRLTLAVSLGSVGLWLGVCLTIITTTR